MACAHSVETVVIGMPHRGRLNVLANVLRMPLEDIFASFSPPAARTVGDEHSGDVKYHLGTSRTKHLPVANKDMHMSVVANPSHLEAVDPVVIGKVRAEQLFADDAKRKRVVPVLLHGDAAFCGQGVVFETFGLSGLADFTVGGTVHIVVNNQIGFTTDPVQGRSSPYATEVAKTVSAPIFHVNGDDVESVVRICNMAMEWRQTFGCDVVVDIVCYRKYGHNELDQPMFTQPRMYQAIAKKESILSIYTRRAIAENIVTQEQVDAYRLKYRGILQAAYEKIKSTEHSWTEWLDSKWKGFSSRKQLSRIRDTGVSLDTLRHIGRVISTYPADFHIHSQLGRILKQRLETIESGDGLDWATAEALAFGTLLLEHNHVRLSGQDVERGTFSQRHHVLHDQVTFGRRHVPLAHLREDQAVYTVCNSSLSEYAVLGFELGYSMTNPNMLVLWEAQFGDFSNTAQCIIDQFISCGEEKWNRMTGITLLLPHGYDGMGAEHSSARMERFLAMCDDDADEYPDMNHNTRLQIQGANWQVLNCTTPANFYHALRRQVHREFRKPLIVFTPKSLLRHPMAKSSLADMSEGTRFRRLIPETRIAASAGVRRLIFCTGKIYYELVKARDDAGVDDIAIARVEQISPFPFDLCHRQADDYPQAELVWCQEEPKNMGAWTYVQPRFETALLKSASHNKNPRLRYVGRSPSAATATGHLYQHLAEQKTVIQQALHRPWAQKS